ncbi:MAG: hypothetical protein ACHQ1H_00470 [Nitrososphaerales archaeon]
MYSSIETRVSEAYLSQILTGVSQPPCLIGGWAVYYTVNDNFRKAKLHDYLGSRDIDLGFHFDPFWTKKQFQSSSYNATITKLLKMGFEEISYRYFKQHSMEDGHQLSPEEAKTTDQFMIFNMYVDLLVDTKNPNRNKVAGFTVLEEPLLSAVFSGKESTQKKLFGIMVTMPSPSLLTKIKLKSFPGREEDKKLKDLMDICALLQYSGQDPPNFTSSKSDQTIRENYLKTLDDISNKDWGTVARSLDSDTSLIKRIARRV